MSTETYVIRDKHGRFYLNVKSSFMSVYVKLPFSKTNKEDQFELLFTEEEKDNFVERMNNRFIGSDDLVIQEAFFSENNIMVFVS